MDDELIAVPTISRDAWLAEHYNPAPALPYPYAGRLGVLRLFCHQIRSNREARRLHGDDVPDWCRRFWWLHWERGLARTLLRQLMCG